MANLSNCSTGRTKFFKKKEKGPAKNYLFVVCSAEQGKGETMPFVNIKITPDGATKEKKELLIASVTKLLQDLLDKNPQTTVVVIDEVDTDNWGIGGESVTVRRSRDQ